MATKRVKLKPQSPEFAESSKPKAKSHKCDMPGCDKPGDHRAPKDRGLRDYYHFCFDHAQEYNKAWALFERMRQGHIDDHTRNAIYGPRPTWIYTSAPDWEDTLRARAQGYRNFSEDEPKKERKAPPAEATP